MRAFSISTGCFVSHLLTECYLHSLLNCFQEYEEIAMLMFFFCDQDAGGMMTLTDVYCRFNRARGMEVSYFIIQQQDFDGIEIMLLTVLNFFRTRM